MISLSPVQWIKTIIAGLIALAFASIIWSIVHNFQKQADALRAANAKVSAQKTQIDALTVQKAKIAADLASAQNAVKIETKIQTVTKTVYVQADAAKDIINAQPISTPDTINPALVWCVFATVHNSLRDGSPAETCVLGKDGDVTTVKSGAVPDKIP